jgi:hypothetical protein
MIEKQQHRQLEHIAPAAIYQSTLLQHITIAQIRTTERMNKQANLHFHNEIDYTKTLLYNVLLLCLQSSVPKMALFTSDTLAPHIGHFGGKTLLLHF